MGLKIEKKEVPATKKLVAVHVPDAEIADSQCVAPEVIDEMVALQIKVDKAMDEIAEDQKRLEELKKQVLAVADEVTAPEDNAVLTGTGGKGRLEISARAEKAEITNLEQAKKFLGTEVFFKVAKIGITDLKAYLTKPQYDQVTVTTQTGSRRLKIIA